MCILEVNSHNLRIFFFLLNRLHNKFWKHTNSVLFKMHKYRIANF